MKKIIIKESVFSTHLTFYIGYEWDKMLKNIKGNYCEELYNLVSRTSPGDDSMGCMLICPKFDNAFIWMSKFEPSSECFGFLTHEVSHYIFHNLKIRGIKHETESEDEVYSYYLQSIIEQFLNKFF